MKAFPERVAREQVLWLFGHAFPLILLGFVQTRAAWDWVFEQWRHPRSPVEEILSAGAAGFGGVAQMLAGAAIAVLCVRRVFRPFVARKMLLDMKSVLVVEIILLVLTGFILDCGVIQSVAFRGFLAVNLGVLGFAATPRDANAPATETG